MASASSSKEAKPTKRDITAILLVWLNITNLECTQLTYNWTQATSRSLRNAIEQQQAQPSLSISLFIDSVDNLRSV
eukprot:scaffold19787_cov196-Amphora_coffeaeformis.AAC.3